MLLCTNRSLVRPYIDLNLARRGSTCSGVYVASGLRREMCAPMSSNRLVAINLEFANSQPTRQHLVQQSGTRVTIVMTLNSTMLAICNIEDKRARERDKERGKPSHERKAPPRLIEGAVTTSWKKALAQLAIAFPDRIHPYL